MTTTTVTTIAGKSHTFIEISNTTYTPPLKELDFPINVGKTWPITTTKNSTTKTIIDDVEAPEIIDVTEISRNYNCTGKETITVGAGIFETFLIKYTDQDGNYSELYYSPEVGNYVKEQYYELYGEYKLLVKSAELLEYSYGPYKPPSPTNLWIWLMIAMALAIALGIAIIFVKLRR